MPESGAGEPSRVGVLVSQRKGDGRARNGSVREGAALLSQRLDRDELGTKAVRKTLIV